MELRLNERFRFLTAIVLSVMLLMAGCEIIEDLIEDIDNDNGIENGNDVLTDADGNQYKTVVIGDQEWMAENLRTTKYADGSPIPGGLPDEEWMENSQGAYAVYEYDDVDIAEAYGKLYNWYAVDNMNGLCPQGWRVPGDDDWHQLTAYLEDVLGIENENTEDGAGNALKVARQVNHPWGGEYDTDEHPRWDSNNVHFGTDEVGFAGLPGGRRYAHGSYGTLANHAHWWAAEESSAGHAWTRGLFRTQGNLNRVDQHKPLGLSVRCVRAQ